MTSNQRSLAVISAILWGTALLMFRSITMEGGGMASAAFAAAFPAVLGTIPILLIRRSRRPRRRHKSIAHLVKSRRSSGQEFADVTISSSQKLPKVCIRCGTPTRRVSPFRHEGNHTDVSPYDWTRLNPIVFFLMVWRFAFYLVATKLCEMLERRWNRRMARGQAVVFRVPHCRKCASANPVVQRHFDFHGRIMVVEAHSAFRERMRSQ